MSANNLVIVDDHPIVIQGLSALLQGENDLHIAGTFTTGNAFLAFLKGAPQVDIVLLDITLPDISGVEVCKEIKRLSPETKVLIISNHSERSIIMQMLQQGASGYLLKNASSEELVKCVHDVLAGRIALSAEVTAIMTRPLQNELKNIPHLTKREIQVLGMIAEGRTSASIAEELCVSQFTVETHRRNLMQKFDANNTAALIKMASEHKLL
ncbi:response regulator [Chitinophaga niabensis]|uniref:DNA-binding response regulator, NarL/FixJ family, contains REC and HTH domains n=1 Tax=Chitinophaga niabensis TaxID=536979 RepID=A0A1N6K126_9BACT|nr:response regulator transcription factor [Chitinophaga niabensis]SIO50036.1 DNA-binding response regulator, NarL/FixJ family, contains REC and HTH domains [Chitinophaga niabensis]